MPEGTGVFVGAATVGVRVTIACSVDVGEGLTDCVGFTGWVLVAVGTSVDVRVAVGTAVGSGVEVAGSGTCGGYRFVRGTISRAMLGLVQRS